MLKTRIIPLLILQDGLIKKPIRFKNPRTIANPISVVRVFEEREVDELVLLDRSSSIKHGNVSVELIEKIAEELQVPFAFGGGLDSLELMKAVIQAGAEKIVLNTTAIRNPKLISQAAKKFGSQCVIISVDVLKNSKNQYEVYIKNGNIATGIDAIKWIKKAESLGAGEVLVNSIAHDGCMNGYDIPLIKAVINETTVPVIAAGGAGNVQDFVELARASCPSAFAAGSIYHYTKYTPNMIKGVLAEMGISVRMYHDVDYTIT